LANIAPEYKKLLTKTWEAEHKTNITPEILEYLLAIRIYTSDYIYQILNKALWDTKSTNEQEKIQTDKVLSDWEVMCFQIFKGIVNIPGPSLGNLGYVTLYRKFKDASFITDDYVVGNVIVWLGFSSTSVNEHSYHGAALCEIVLKQPELGAVIWKYSLYQNENEVLLPPFTSFKVLEVSKNVNRGSGSYAKYVKVECIGLTQKVSKFVVPEKEKKNSKT